jgi:dolichol-phosphate mannosyltransferase
VVNQFAVGFFHPLKFLFLQQIGCDFHILVVPAAANRARLALNKPFTQGCNLASHCLLERLFAFAGFYKVLNFVSPLKFEANASDFFAIARPAADVLRQEYRERVRYLRGYVQSLGFNKTTLEFMAAKREAGESHYNIRKLIRFSISTICSFSDMPLKLGIYSGLAAALIGVIVMIYSLVNKLVNDVPAGYSTIIVVLCFMFAATLLIIGIIGEYIAILFAEVKERPIYIVREVIQSGKAQTTEINKIKRGDSL